MSTTGSGFTQRKMNRLTFLNSSRRRKKFRKKIQKIHFTRMIVPRTDGENGKNYSIFEDGFDFTPKALNDENFKSIPENMFITLPFSRAIAFHANLTGKTPTTSRYASRSSMMSISNNYRTSHSIIRNITDSRTTLSENVRSAKSLSIDLTKFSVSALSYVSDDAGGSLADKPPSLFKLREDPPPRNPTIPRKFTVTLQESETEFLFSIESTSEYVDSETGIIITNKNALYEDTLSKTKSISQTATQTVTTANVRKEKFSLIARNKRQNTGAFAANWDIYDTYLETELLRTSALDRELNAELEKEKKMDNLTTIHDDKDDQYFSSISFMGVHLGKKFIDSVLIMERLITAYSYKNEQLSYQGLYEQDPFSLEVEYKYSLKLLWTFSHENTEDKVVTSISLSPINENIIAVGYGKLKYTDNKNGLVCCWNIKNPITPERIYKFEQPVTCTTFSKEHPNILAVSFYSGYLILLDVTRVVKHVTASNSIYPLYHPVRKVCWFSNEDNNIEFPVTCGKDGKIFKYRKTEFFTSKLILSVTRIDGKVQGSEQPKKCYPNKTLVSRHPSAECMVPHPADHRMYYIGTSEGSVYKCSINYCHHHLEVFVAHNGPVYGIEFHPFCAKVFLTYGGDWCIKVWAEGVFEPLITLISGMQAVEAAVWHPLNSTIIVNIRGKDIEMWDIRRKTFHPKSTTVSPSNSFNTALAFTKNGHNICIGDANGNTHVMALAEMPFSPAFQETVFVHSLHKVLISKPELLAKLHKLGPPFHQTSAKFYKNSKAEK